MQKLTNKIFIEGSINCETGLRIGGNKSSLEIGGVDLNIIKSAGGVPYIPGSSIKGKLRSLLAKLEGSDDAGSDSDSIKNLFGGGGGKEASTITRLFVRDAPLDTASFEKKFTDKNKRDFDYSEVKTENVIERSTGKAQHPRNIERVPAGAIFNFQMVIDIYDGDNEGAFLKTIETSFELLEYDYLGGHGSRGSGKVKLTVNKVSSKKLGSGQMEDMQNAIFSSLTEKFAAAKKETSNI